MPDDALDDPTRAAVEFFWTTRDDQLSAQADAAAGGAARAARHLHGMRDLVEEIFVAAGMPRESVTREGYLPGYYRARKRWDLAVIYKGVLVAALEFKSQSGSVRNNINNRLEEALGNATDLWTAQHKLAAYGDIRPWLGFVLVLGEDGETEAPDRPTDALFPTDPAFTGTSYNERYQVMIRRLIDEDIYQAGWFISTSRAEDGTVSYREPLAAASHDAFRDAVEARVTRIRSLLDLVTPFSRRHATDCAA